MTEHRIGVGAKLTDPGCLASCSCGWNGPVREDHHVAAADGREHFSSRADVSPLPSPVSPPGTPTTGSEPRKEREDSRELSPLDSKTEGAAEASTAASQGVGLSADVTRLEGELEARSAKSAETRGPTNICRDGFVYWGTRDRDTSKFREGPEPTAGSPAPSARPGGVAPTSPSLIHPETCEHCAAVGRCPNPLPRAAEVRVKELEQTVSALTGALEAIVQAAVDAWEDVDAWDDGGHLWREASGVGSDERSKAGGLSHASDIARAALSAALPSSVVPVEAGTGTDEARSTKPVETRDRDGNVMPTCEVHGAPWVCQHVPGEEET